MYIFASSFRQCRASGEMPYQLTKYKTHYPERLRKTKVIKHIQRKPNPKRKSMQALENLW